MGLTASVLYKFLRHLFSLSLLHFSCPRMFLHFAVRVLPVTLIDLMSYVLRNSLLANALATRRAFVKRLVKVSFIVRMDRVKSRSSGAWYGAAGYKVPIRP